ncbi:hypothetical protein J437_LFUL007959 [Ladona fulva]|uniref:Solute carrier organic anion transporter family member n=1 Tax=Ladona fulva TaxID=123851 RepID=A0A8K0P1Y6_LADFU|nr:hypothetical protein J437_LFUL007959 [Ladona fulva]
MDALAGRDGRCGVACFAPRWLERFATAKAFLVVYGFLGTLQAMAYIYFVATLTTLEKRFKIPSQTTGIMMSGNEVSQILLSLLLTYLGGRGNRPIWIAWGVAISSASCLILALPHLVYGPGEDALMLTKEYAPISPTSNRSLTVELHPPTSPHGERLGLCSADGGSPTKDSQEDRCKVDGDFSAMPLALVFLSQFVLGIGTTLYFALGQTYLDDNTAKRKTPMLLGMVLALRTVGPALGFLLGWACLSLYIDPSLTPLITKKDPRWLGAWWLGWIILTVALLIFSLLIAMFPKHLPKKKKAKSLKNSGDCLQPLTETKESPIDGELSERSEWENSLKEKDEPKLKDFPTALARLLRNKILMVNIFAGVFYILGASGYITFLTKYMETQFNQSAAGASIIAGTVGIMAMVGGFLVSGIVITKVRPRPRLLLGWNVLVGMAYIVGELSFIGIGCSTRPLHGSSLDGRLQLDWECNAGCGCEQYLKYSPVCSADGKLTFYSACHAGCKSIKEDVIKESMGGVLSAGKTINRKYENCSCIATNFSRQSQSDWGETMIFPDFDPSPTLGLSGASEGPCSAPDCGTPFALFITISCIMHFLGSSGKIGNILVNYRSVKPEDKAFAQGLSLLLISLLAFIPGPILYGAIIDNVCLVWDKSCGRRGNCWLYHQEYFRFYLNSTAAVFTFIAVVLDGVVCYLGKDLELYKEDEEDQDSRTLSKTTNRTEDSMIFGEKLEISEK